jgi:hypothetical protein
VGVPSVGANQPGGADETREGIVCVVVQKGSSEKKRKGYGNARRHLMNRPEKFLNFDFLFFWKRPP